MRDDAWPRYCRYAPGRFRRFGSCQFPGRAELVPERLQDAERARYRALFSAVSRRARSSHDRRARHRPSPSAVRVTSTRRGRTPILSARRPVHLTSEVIELRARELQLCRKSLTSHDSVRKMERAADANAAFRSDGPWECLGRRSIRPETRKKRLNTQFAPGKGMAPAALDPQYLVCSVTDVQTPPCGAICR